MHHHQLPPPLHIAPRNNGTHYDPTARVFMSLIVLIGIMIWGGIVIPEAIEEGAVAKDPLRLLTASAFPGLLIGPLAPVVIRGGFGRPHQEYFFERIFAAVVLVGASDLFTASLAHTENTAQHVGLGIFTGVMLLANIAFIYMDKLPSMTAVRNIFRWNGQEEPRHMHEMEALRPHLHQ